MSHPSTERTLQRARSAAARPVMLREQSQLDAVSEDWQQLDVIGLDTEFVRERTYFAQPGLVQLSDGETVWLLDPLSISDMAPLTQLLNNPGTCKILHSAGEDLEVLAQLAGAVPDPLFDTQVAAALTGRPLQMAYEKLVEDVLGESLPGGKARSNWLKRPLPDDLLQYAAQDVAFLPELMKVLRDTLEASGRLDWLNEDCARTLEAARQPAAPEQAWQRVKGAGSLDDDACFRLMALAAWRERQATKFDRPRRFIVGDEVLIEIARRAPVDQDALAGIPGLPKPVLRREGAQLLALAREAAPGTFKRPPALEKMDGAQRERLREMQRQVRRMAEKLNLDAALISSKRELTRWLQEGTPAWLDGWRGQFLDGDFAKI